MILYPRKEYENRYEKLKDEPRTTYTKLAKLRRHHTKSRIPAWAGRQKFIQLHALGQRKGDRPGAICTTAFSVLLHRLKPILRK